MKSWKLVYLLKTNQHLPVQCKPQLTYIFINSDDKFIFREERYEFIRAKYVDKRFVMRTCASEQDLLYELEHALNNQDLNHLLQVFGENVDLSSSLPSSVNIYNRIDSFTPSFMIIF